MTALPDSGGESASRSKPVEAIARDPSWESVYTSECSWVFASGYSLSLETVCWSGCSKEYSSESSWVYRSGCSKEYSWAYWLGCSWGCWSECSLGSSWVYRLVYSKEYSSAYWSEQGRHSYPSSIVLPHSDNSIEHPGKYLLFLAMHTVVGRRQRLRSHYNS